MEASGTDEIHQRGREAAAEREEGRQLDKMTKVFKKMGNTEVRKQKQSGSANDHESEQRQPKSYTFIRRNHKRASDILKRLHYKSEIL